MREVDIERTAYPQLNRNITDREIIERYTLEPEELSLVKNYRGDSLSLAVRLKVFGHLLSHNLSLSEVPQRVIGDLVNEAIFHLMEVKVELPSFQRLLRLAAKAKHKGSYR